MSPAKPQGPDATAKDHNTEQKNATPAVMIA
jgi:hypothetical protein